jgi:hypothetical protein
MAEWTPEARRLFDRLLYECFNPVRQAEHLLRLAEYESNRTDPWRWYCRTCGAEGQADTEQERDQAGYAHLSVCPHGLRVNVGTESIGRLRHVWSYGGPA